MTATYTAHQRAAEAARPHQTHTTAHSPTMTKWAPIVFGENAMAFSSTRMATDTRGSSRRAASAPRTEAEPDRAPEAASGATGPFGAFAERARDAAPEAIPPAETSATPFPPASESPSADIGGAAASQTARAQGSPRAEEAKADGPQKDPHAVSETVAGGCALMDDPPPRKVRGSACNR